MNLISEVIFSNEVTKKLEVEADFAFSHFSVSVYLNFDSYIFIGYIKSVQAVMSIMIR